MRDVEAWSFGGLDLAPWVIQQAETQRQSSLKRAVEEELEWVHSNARGQQKKGKARLRAYEDLRQQVSLCLHSSQQA